MKHIELFPLPFPPEMPHIYPPQDRVVLAISTFRVPDLLRIPSPPDLYHIDITVPSLAENRVSYADNSTSLRDKIHHQVMPILMLSLTARDYLPRALDDISSTQTRKVKTSKLLEALLQRIEY